MEKVKLAITATHAREIMSITSSFVKTPFYFNLTTGHLYLLSLLEDYFAEIPILLRTTDGGYPPATVVLIKVP
jgi:hypothetical protein